MLVPPASGATAAQTSEAVSQVPPPPPPPAQHTCPSPPQGLQVPALPAVRLRPWQTKPVEQVPVLPVPQHAWPEPPQLPHTFPLADNEQPRPVAHAGVLGQQVWPEPPQDSQIPPASAP
jgi:hypothetical protein